MFAGDGKNVRPPAVAGSFYPLDAALLKDQVGDLLAGAESASRGRVRVGGEVDPHGG